MFYKKKFIFWNLVIILIIFFAHKSFSVDINGKEKFKSFFIDLEKKIPEKFNCELKSRLFDDIFNQLPEEAFLDKTKKPPKIVLYYEKGKSPLYRVKNIYDDYKPFVKNYFSFLNDSMAFLIFTETKINEIMEQYNIKYFEHLNKNVFEVTKKDDNRSLNLFVDKRNQILKGIDIYFNGQKYIKLNFKFKTIKSYLVPLFVNIVLLDEEQKITIYFINYKIFK